jgi:hypothetical protein
MDHDVSPKHKPQATLIRQPGLRNRVYAAEALGCIGPAARAALTWAILGRCRT